MHAGEMTAAALDPRPEAFAEVEVLFGDLATKAEFLEPYLSTRRSLVERGVHATLDDLLGWTYRLPGADSAARAALSPRLSTSLGGFCDDSSRR